MICAFEFQPTLRGEIVELRPLRASDYEELRKVAADPLIWEQHPVRERWRRSVFDRYFEDRLMGGGCLVTIERSSGLIVGASEFSAFSSDERQVEIGATFLARRCWGGAYNGEVKRLMIDHAFASVDSVVFSVSEANRRSQAALVKIGATVDRRFMRHGTGYLGFRIRKCAWLEGEIPRR